MHLGRVLCALLCLLVVLSGGEATLSKKDKKGKKKKEQVDPICTLLSARQSCDSKNTGYKEWLLICGLLKHLQLLHDSELCLIA